MQNTDSVEECTKTTLNATEQKKSFDAYREGENIPDDYQCQWVITDSTNMPIQVSIEIVKDDVSQSTLLLTRKLTKFAVI